MESDGMPIAERLGHSRITHCVIGLARGFFQTQKISTGHLLEGMTDREPTVGKKA
jgi:hypothetical protein